MNREKEPIVVLSAVHFRGGWEDVSIASIEIRLLWLQTMYVYNRVAFYDDFAN